MNTDVEDLLRQGMERFTRDLRVPAGMTGRAARRRRLRRLALRSVGAAAAALSVGGVALAAAGVPGAPHDGIDATGNLVKRVRSALSSAEPGTIAQMTVTTRAAAPGGTNVAAVAEQWSFGGQWRSVANWPAGRPVYDEGSTNSSVYTLVSYLTQTWARQRALGRPVARAPGPGSCEPVIAAVPVLFPPGLPGTGLSARSPAPPARALRTAISCGTLAVAGRQLVDGIEAIELTSRPDSLIAETIWVSPGSYLPVRMILRSARGKPVLRQTADITWLRPTAQNLAKLTVPIPAGFRQVPLAEVVVPILQQTEAGLPKSEAAVPFRPGEDVRAR